jgi:hypothetical protein
MKIRIMSDLHLEITKLEVVNSTGADVLVLAGDILVANKIRKENSEEGKYFRNFLQKISGEFENIVYVAGNHEFYNDGKFFEGLTWLQEECDKYNNLYFLERSTVALDDVVFIGATMWTDFNHYDPLTMLSAEGMMNDYRTIVHDYDGYRRLQPKDVALRHKLSLNYIKLLLSENKNKTCVVVTHHGPSFQSMDPRYRNDSLGNGLYYSDLDDLIWDNPQISLWCHGHTHHPQDYKINRSRVVCNPRGYAKYGEYSGWDPIKTVELERFNEQNLQGQTLEIQEP